MDAEEIKKTLFNSAMKGEWNKVVEIYGEFPDAHDTRITRTGETALHVAVSDGQEDTVEDLLDLIMAAAGEGSNRTKAVLEIKNDSGNTPLHYAASVGSVRMCQCIAQQDPLLVGARNIESETPLFMAALHGKKDVFLRLHYLCSSKNEKDISYCRRKDGQTALHSAINGDYFDLAFQIIHLYEDLVHYANEQGLSPLHLLATMASSFGSGTHLGWGRSTIYHCIFVDQLKEEPLDYQALSVRNLEKEKNSHFPENYRTCVQFFQLLKSFVGVTTFGKRPLLVSDKKAQTEKPRIDIDQPHGQPVLHQRPTIHKARDRQLLPSNYLTCLEFIKFLSKIMLVILGLGSEKIKKIREKKEKNTWSAQVMNELIKRALVHEYDDNGRHPHHVIHREGKEEETLPYRIVDGGSAVLFDNLEDSGPETSKGNFSKAKQGDGAEGKKVFTDDMLKGETAIPLAAKNGVTEMVEKILEDFPVAIHDMNSEKKNIVLLAVENRQPHVYKLMLKRNILKDNIFRRVDNKGNSALHLAAMLRDYKPWLIPGAALQMQWEMKWFEFVKSSMPRHFFVRYNDEGKTANNIFTETHSELLKNGSNWLTNTSQSCSVVAVLIATVAFATSTTVPGGVREESGKPTLEDEPAFNVFAISSLVALCFSVTSVILFLSILTSRYEERDFGRDLLRKLLVGLTSLFVSIASMLVSFCAGHFFVLKDKLKYAAYPVYAVTCLPVTFFAMAQFPLYFDLVWATFKKVPQRSYK
ncbi:uncharacterized protein LOC116210315 [Punica granatum]|uniref:Uncharacterized protein LOC116210315 n=1 Tax=Punica granatum TaxID=22663 RepID=A0A6P8DWC4_PUNGR|nr:uncharacterized protein LOC116210315 [Punica granatum]